MNSPLCSFFCLQNYHTRFIWLSFFSSTELPGYGLVYKDQISSTKIPVHLKSSSPICSACENFTNKAVSYLSNKQTQDKIVEFLHDACKQSFSLEQKVIILSIFVDSYN
jgi:hypothetical protein